jgi:hypothetical protein
LHAAIDLIYMLMTVGGIFFRSDSSDEDLVGLSDRAILGLHMIAALLDGVTLMLVIRKRRNAIRVLVALHLLSLIPAATERDIALAIIRMLIVSFLLRLLASLVELDWVVGGSELARQPQPRWLQVLLLGVQLGGLRQDYVRAMARVERDVQREGAGGAEGDGGEDASNPLPASADTSGFVVLAGSAAGVQAVALRPAGAERGNVQDSASPPPAAVSESVAASATSLQGDFHTRTSEPSECSIAPQGCVALNFAPAAATGVAQDMVEGSAASTRLLAEAAHEDAAVRENVAACDNAARAVPAAEGLSVAELVAGALHVPAVAVAAGGDTLLHFGPAASAAGSMASEAPEAVTGTLQDLEPAAAGEVAVVPAAADGILEATLQPADTLQYFAPLPAGAEDVPRDTLQYFAPTPAGTEAGVQAAAQSGASASECSCDVPLLLPAAAQAECVASGVPPDPVPAVSTGMRVAQAAARREGPGAR